MIAFALASLFIAAAAVALGTIGTALCAALPRARELKLALAECPQQHELRFTIREMVAGPAQGKVVALPVRFRPAALSQPLRAAA